MARRFTLRQTCVAYLGSQRDRLSVCDDRGETQRPQSFNRRRPDGVDQTAIAPTSLRRTFLRGCARMSLRRRPGGGGPLPVVWWTVIPMCSFSALALLSGPVMSNTGRFDTYGVQDRSRQGLRSVHPGVVTIAAIMPSRNPAFHWARVENSQVHLLMRIWEIRRSGDAPNTPLRTSALSDSGVGQGILPCSSARGSLGMSSTEPGMVITI